MRSPNPFPFGEKLVRNRDRVTFPGFGGDFRQKEFGRTEDHFARGFFRFSRTENYSDPRPDPDIEFAKTRLDKPIYNLCALVIN